MLVRNLLLSLFSCAVVVEAAEQKIFPEFDSLSQELRMPRNAVVKVDGDGNFLVNGQCRYLPGTFIAYNNLALNLIPTAGYSPSLKWLYEDVLTYEYAQRLGFDSLFVLGPNDWMRRLKPNFKVYGESSRNTEMAKRLLNNGLPLCVDFTAASWAHGELAGKKELRALVAPEVLNTRADGRANNHWMPFSIYHPEGRKLYQLMWQGGLENFKKLSGNPMLFVELFNEPAYNDPSDGNKQLFERSLAEKFKSVNEMNRQLRFPFASFAQAASLEKLGQCPPLAVLWEKFMEEGFTQLNRIGRETVRNTIPGALTSSQIIGSNYYRVLPLSFVDIYRVSEIMDIISTPTSGGLALNSAQDSAPKRSVEALPLHASVGEGILMRHLFRAMADGKPIINPEAYGSNDRERNINATWIDLLRGSGATYFFSWCRRAIEWNPPGSAEGGKKHAEKFRYVLTNPYAVSPEALTGFGEAKREIHRFQEFFVPRRRFADFPREVAVMLSYPTERYGVPTGYILKNEIGSFMAALEFSHYLPDGIFEEQLAADRQKRYRALITVGLRNTYAGSLQKLEEFVRQGGILIAARNVPTMDELGNPQTSPLFAGLKNEELVRPVSGSFVWNDGFSSPLRLSGTFSATLDARVECSEEWRIAASVKGMPALLERNFGKGKVWFLAPALTEYAAAAVLGTVLDQANVQRAFEFSRIPQGDQAVNLEVHPARKEGLTLAFVYNFDCYPKLTAVRLPQGAECAADLLSNRLLPLEKGRALFAIGDHGRVILGFGKREALENKFGKLLAVSAGDLRKFVAEREVVLQEEMRRKRAAGFSFEVNSAEAVTLDLKPFANRSFLDDKPGDGKGGWTDQGRENSLQGVPWGVQQLLGVPCDLIRFDENADKSCLMLRSTSLNEALPEKVEGIRVGFPVARLFFFHTAAWNGAKGVPVMTYRIRYADGSHVDVPVRDRIEISNWWGVGGPDTIKNRVAWQNLEKRGFYVMEWLNPHPGNPVASIDIISACGKVIPIVIGITAERFTGEKTILPFSDTTTAGWGGCQVEKTGMNSYSALISSKTGDWAGFRVNLKKPFTIPVEKWERAVLKFRIAGGKTRGGVTTSGLAQPVILQIWSSKKIKSSRPVLRDAGNQSFSLAELMGGREKTEDVALVSFQFSGVAEAGFSVEDLRVEY